MERPQISVGFYSIQYAALPTAQLPRNPISIHISEKLGEYITHPDLAFRSSTDPTHSAFNLAYNTTLPFIGANSWMTTYPDEALKWNAA